MSWTMSLAGFFPSKFGISDSKRISREPQQTRSWCVGLEARSRDDRPPTMNIAVFCPNLIGDTVMATPAFRALRQGFPNDRLIGVIKPKVAPTLAGNPWFDDLIYFDHASNNRLHRTIPVIRRLRREKFQVALLLPNTFRSAWVAWMGGIKERVGYVRHARGLLLSVRLHEPWQSGQRKPTPIVESYLRLARQIGCKTESLRTELFTTPDDEAAADRAFAGLGLGGPRRLVCLNTGGAFGPAKTWPVDHFAELARRLADQADVSVLVVCGPDEREPARQIVQAASHARVVSLANLHLSIGLTKACVRRSALLITTDSGPRHFASAFNTPVITLFGPTHIAWTRTYHPHAWHMFHPVPCGPCQRRICPEGHHRCMRDLSPESVLAAALRALQATERNVSEPKVLVE
jgi:heptosyltransferase II